MVAEVVEVPMRPLAAADQAVVALVVVQPLPQQQAQII
jgi:hypothetical protein